MQKVRVRGQRSRSQRSKPYLAVTGPFEYSYGDKIMQKAWSSIQKVSYCCSGSSVNFQGHTATKSSILTQIVCFRIVTPVSIHWWRWNDAQTWRSIERVLYFSLVMSQISKSHETENHRLWPKFGVFGLLPQFEFTNGIKQCTHFEAAWRRYFILFLGHPSNFKVTRNKNNWRFWPESSVSGL